MPTDPMKRTAYYGGRVEFFYRGPSRRRVIVTNVLAGVLWGAYAVFLWLQNLPLRFVSLALAAFVTGRGIVLYRQYRIWRQKGQSWIKPAR